MEKLIKRIEEQILKTPSGEIRNLLSDINIALSYRELIVNGVNLIEVERERQIKEEGYDPVSDYQRYGNQELARAGACYALPHSKREETSLKTEADKQRYDIMSGVPRLWPKWDHYQWKPTPHNRIKELTKAGALIAAQIDIELTSKGLSTRNYYPKGYQITIEDEINRINNLKPSNDGD